MEEIEATDRKAISDRLGFLAPHMSAMRVSGMPFWPGCTGYRLSHETETCAINRIPPLRGGAGGERGDGNVTI